MSRYINELKLARCVVHVKAEDGSSLCYFFFTSIQNFTKNFIITIFETYF